jgi:23S rRNA-/tRNA-specific pseudouridylate synthase
MFQQLRTARDPRAARAELRYSVERLFADASLVRVELVTGLQNQIRAQFSAMATRLSAIENTTGQNRRNS